MATSFLLTLSLSWNNYLEGGQPLCYKHPEERLHDKKWRPSANGHASEPGSRHRSQIKPSDGSALAELLTAVPWETLSQNYLPKLLPDSCQIALHINRFPSKILMWKIKQNCDFPCTPVDSSETGWGDTFLLFEASWSFVIQQLIANTIMLDVRKCKDSKSHAEETLLVCKFPVPRLVPHT